MASMFRMYQQMKDLMEALEPLSADKIFQSCSDTSGGGSSAFADIKDGGINVSSDASDDDTKYKSGSDSMHSGGMNPGMMEMLKSMVPPENQAMVEMLMQMNHPS